MTDAVPPFNLKYWPFDLVPRSGMPLVWAGRKELKKQIELLGRRLARHRAASLHLLWADFGAGKTHALLFFKQMADLGEFGHMLPFYCALPKGCRSFLDIYRAIARSIPVAVIQDRYQMACGTVGRSRTDAGLAGIWPAFTRCIQVIAIGSDQQRDVAVAWLHAEANVPARQLHALGVMSRIRSTDDAVMAVCGLIRLFQLANVERVVLMIDEFQRVEVLRRQQQDEINAGLHSVFNACGGGLSLVLSFSFGEEANIRHFLNPELLSRADPLRISIPALSFDEGIVFLSEAIQFARIGGSNWPVADNFIPAIVTAVSNNYKLTPRRLLKAGGLVFGLAAIELEDGELKRADEDFIRKVVASGGFDRLDDGDQD